MGLACVIVCGYLYILFAASLFVARHESPGIVAWYLTLVDDTQHVSVCLGCSFRAFFVYSLTQFQCEVCGVSKKRLQIMVSEEIGEQVELLSRWLGVSESAVGAILVAAGLARFSEFLDRPARFQAELRDALEKQGGLANVDFAGASSM